MQQFHICLFIAFFFIVIDLKQCSSSDSKTTTNYQNKHDFDVIIFAQRWPVTGCMEWITKNKRHSCSLPSPKEIWTIHGVWPSKYDHFGPEFCNSSAAFNISELTPYLIQLQQFWLNIEKGKGIASLWKHEWLKHGTCAAQLAALNTENKYFGQGLSWLQQYTMSSVLQKGAIMPDTNHTVINIHSAIVSILGHNPSIHCFIDPNQNLSYLNEIRICFDKSLEIIDCDHVLLGDDAAIIKHSNGQIITNCPLSQNIQYPNMVPPSQLHRKNEDTPWKFPFVNVYKLIQLVQWFTL